MNKQIDSRIFIGVIALLVIVGVFFLGRALLAPTAATGGAASGKVVARPPATPSPEELRQMRLHSGR
jgi:hypothetical protein